MRFGESREKKIPSTWAPVWTQVLDLNILRTFPAETVLDLGAEATEQLLENELLGFATVGWYLQLELSHSLPLAPFYVIFALVYWRDPFQQLILFLFQLSRKWGGLTKVTVKSSISQCVFVCHTVILDSWGGTWGHLWLQRLWEAQEVFASVLVCQSNIWQVTMPEALQHQGGTCKSQPALKKETRNKASGQQVKSCCFPHVLQGSERGGHFQPGQLLMAIFNLEMLSTFGHALLWAPGTWQWECSKPWVEGVMDALLLLPATFLSCTAEPLLGLDLIPSCDNRQPVLSC